jgi:hypothetical protein
LFSVCFSSKQFSSARCSSAINVAVEDVDVEPKLCFLVMFHNGFFFVLSNVY